MTASTRLACFAIALLAAPISWSKGSAEAGATVAATCQACHGANGNSANPEWPNLAGQNTAYLEHQLHLLHDGMRTGVPGDAGASIMPAMAAALSDQNIEDVAVYFSIQTPAGLEADPSYWQAGQKLYRGGDRARGIPACAACHGPTGRGNPGSGYPALRAQQSMYVVKQLKAYSTGERYSKSARGTSNGGENALIMQTIAARLTPEDMRDIASYLQGLR